MFSSSASSWTAVQAQDVLGDEAVRHEAVLVARDELEDGFVHALREDAHENLVVVVEEREGSVVAWVAAVLLLVEDADDAASHAFWEFNVASALVEHVGEDWGGDR